MSSVFERDSRSPSAVRTGILRLPPGDIPTPFFMPIATRGAVRIAPFSVLRALGASIVLSNTFHLVLRPGVDRIRHFGGLHDFFGWRQAILTDSGGFQVFSLEHHRLVDDTGVTFRSPVDGAHVALTPESVIDAQLAFGSDILMVLDEVCGLPAPDERLAAAVDRTTRWAERSHQTFRAQRPDTERRPLLFGIVQGGITADLRKRSADALRQIGFDGYAIGGLSVGESQEDMLRTLDATLPHLPPDQPRYLMGVGEPEDIVEAVRRGIDMFDCVLPTRNARHGLLYADLNRQYLTQILHAPLSERVVPDQLYQRVRISGEAFADDRTPLNVFCSLLAGVTRGYLRHLFHVDVPVAQTIATTQNLWFYLDLMRTIRTEAGVR